jgi:hypothetical protein
MKEFLWLPGKGYDAVALNRLQKHFLCPSEPMGEAWFNTNDRYYFDHLFNDFSAISTCNLMYPLEEIACGTSSFGAMKEWHD